MRIPFRLGQLRPRVLIVFAIGIVGGLVVGAVIWLNSGLPSDAAFSYRGRVVTKAQLNAKMQVLGALYGIQTPTDKGALDSFHRASAQAVAISMIIDDAARREGVVISDKAARDALDKMIASQSSTSPQQAFQDLLARFGVTQDQVLAEIKRQQEVGALFQRHTASAVSGVKPADVQAFFTANPTRFAVPDKRALLNIVVTTQTQAADVLTQLNNGADFGTLAGQLSLDPATKSSGGSLGTVAQADLESGYGQAAFAAGVGAVFGPVQTTSGWNVGKVTEVVPGHSVNFQDVQAQVEQALDLDRASAAWRAWLVQQLKSGDVQYAAAYRPAHPDEPPASLMGAP